MTANEIIEKKYTELLKYCAINKLHGYENTTGFKSSEDKDLMHDIMINFISKNENIEFATLDEGYNQLKTEFLGEMNFQKKDKKNRLNFIELRILPDKPNENE